MEKKHEARKERRATSRAESGKAPQTVELGKRMNSEPIKKKTVADINDVEQLAKLKQDSLSRGKKQRINKKLAQLTGTPLEAVAVQENAKKAKTARQDAKQKVDKMLKKRDEKMAEKSSNKKAVYTPEDKVLINQSKNAKREKRRDNAKTEEDFDALYKDYEKKLLKKLGKEDKKGPAFEEIEFSD